MNYGKDGSTSSREKVSDLQACTDTRPNVQVKGKIPKFYFMPSAGQVRSGINRKEAFSWELKAFKLERQPDIACPPYTIDR
jgi:hypothetical protein